MRSQATFRYELGKPLLVAVSIKNVGSMTIYDATLEYATNIVPAGQESRIFARFKDPQTGVVIAPTEEQLAWVHTRPLTPIDYQRITSGQGHLMVGAHLSFTDDLGRHHDRYLCTSYIPDGLALTGTTCATPAQS